MTLPVLLFVLLALVLVFLLAWASRPPKPLSSSLGDIFELLSRQQHCARLHFILQALHPDDTKFLGKTGNPGLMRTLRAQRREIALQYINQLEEEFETLLEISRAIAVMAPEVTAVEEMSRWRLSLLFSMKCTALRWRLRFGLRPVAGFTALSTLSTGMVRHLETATTSMTHSSLDAAGLAEIENSRHRND